MKARALQRAMQLAPCVAALAVLCLAALQGAPIGSVNPFDLDDGPPTLEWAVCPVAIFRLPPPGDPRGRLAFLRKAVRVLPPVRSLHPLRAPPAR